MPHTVASSSRVVLDLLPETLDVYVYGAGVADVLIAPDLIREAVLW